MKITPGNHSRTYLGKGWTDAPLKKFLVILIMLIVVLPACNRPQQASSGAGSGSSATKAPSTPTPAGTAGGAVLNLERSLESFVPTGSDIQREVGAIQVKFTKAEEDGFLLVQGAGKSDWTETAQFPACGITAKSEGKANITGIFSPNDCMFHLTIDTKYSQPSSSVQGPNCSGPIVFDVTDFSSQIILSPDSRRPKETKNSNWWEVLTVSLSKLESDDVKYCFIPEVIE